MNYLDHSVEGDVATLRYSLEEGESVPFRQWSADEANPHRVDVRDGDAALLGTGVLTEHTIEWDGVNMATLRYGSFEPQ
jgi:hypothetical protein